MIKNVAPGVSGARLADIESALWADHDRADYSKAGKGIAKVQAERAALDLAEIEGGAHLWAARRGPVRQRDVIWSGASEAEIRVLAERRAELMMDRMAGVDLYDMDPEDVAEWLNAQVMPMQGRPLEINPDATSEYQQRRGLIARATDKGYWVRSLRRAVVAMREAEGRARAQVCAQRQQYITDDTMRRRLNQDASNRAMLEATSLENEDGQVFTLAQLSEKSTSNPAIRRGELMTRIRGCEEWAEAHGMAGIFTTQTTPSRFHAVHRHGDINVKWTEADRPTVKAGQQWLCKAWARARAELDRRGLRVFGFRVAEPHHDGTPHWHGLLWCAPRHVGRVAVVIRRHWLKDAGDEPGARAHRFKAKRLEAGGASGYIAKYIAKGIDDSGAVGLEGHDDEINGRVVRTAQEDMFGGGAARVGAWARAHGIRQFQPIGQPPVTVWRELRRVSLVQAGAASERVQSMWQAAQREGDKRASWSLYMVRQGGAMVGRDYRVGLDTEATEVEGKYETFTKRTPVGVIDRVEGKRAASDRKEWRPKGAWGKHDTSCSSMVASRSGVGLRVGAGGHRADACGGHRRGDVGAPVLAPVGAAVSPWTRVNNCTGRHLENIAGKPVWQIKKEAGRLKTWAEIVKEGVKGPFLKPEDERPSHHGNSPGAHRLPNMRHPQGDADHP